MVIRRPSRVPIARSGIALCSRVPIARSGIALCSCVPIPRKPGVRGRPGRYLSCYRGNAIPDKESRSFWPPPRPLCKDVFGGGPTIRGAPGTPGAARRPSGLAWGVPPPTWAADHSPTIADQRPGRGWRALHTSVRACPRPPGAHGDAAHGGEAPPGTPPDRTAPHPRVAAAPGVRHAGGGSPETLRRFTRSARPGRTDQRCDASQRAWGAAHRRVGDANHDLNESISTPVLVVRGEDLEAEGRGFESEPCAF